MHFDMNQHFNKIKDPQGLWSDLRNKTRTKSLQMHGKAEYFCNSEYKRKLTNERGGYFCYII